MRNFRELNIWKESRKLVQTIYNLTSKLPAEEKFGLTSQINRCVISIPSNIAEGAAKRSDKDFARFLEISLGSSYELETQIILCQDLEFISTEEAISTVKNIQSIQRMISSFIKHLRK